MKIAIFGSAFNPPHKGHMHVISKLIADFDVVLAVPSYKHAFGKSMSDFDDRVAMARLAINENFKNGEAVSVSEVEKEIHAKKNDEEPVYSIELLDHLQTNVFPKDELFLAIGPDNANPETFSRFKDAQRIMDKYGIVVVDELIGYRSSDCRKLISGLAKEKSDEGVPSEWSDKMGHDVATFIFNNHLYGTINDFSSKTPVAPAMASTVSVTLDDAQMCTTF